MKYFEETYGMFGEHGRRRFYAVTLVGEGNDADELLENLSAFGEDQDGDSFEVEVDGEMLRLAERDIAGLFKE